MNELTQQTKQKTIPKQKLVIVGNGMVGHYFIEQLCEHKLTEHFDIQVLGEERIAAYDRVQLSKYFETGNAKSLMLASQQAYAEQGVSLLLDHKVTQIDTANNLLQTEQGCFAYDKLVLATGSYPFVPPIPGKDRQDCLVYRTIDDLDAIAQAAAGAKSGVVIGGGLLGLEAANALKSLNLDTHVVEFAPQLMSVQLNDKAGLLLKHKIEALGLTVHVSKATTEIVDGETAKHRMNFSDGSYLEADMLVFSAGIRPQDELARSANINIGERGGIVIDNSCQTSVNGIYAIGECALWQQKIFGLVAPGYQMAKVVTSVLLEDIQVTQAQLAQSPKQFTGADMSTKLKLLGVDVAAIGESRGFEGAQYVELNDEQSGVYKKLWLDETGQYLKGAVLVGNVEEYSALLNIYLSAEPLLEPAVTLLVADNEVPQVLNDKAIVCSCHQVTKAEIVAQVVDGKHAIADIKVCTKAASGCGGCASLVQRVIDETLLEQGLEVEKGICCHFEYDRQSLFHLCQVESIKDFNELYQRHARSDASSLAIGCEICKPLAASIFATLENEYVLSEQHVALQDTNDAYLGNLQKDGSYSVVPRIAGGEITPDKLIAIGHIAKRYDLYTKITGGQRIDMFGAQLSSLPQIWTELIDAGFETGHAYGKSLRTVKSCVGDTWCRYGVQDSVSLAIALENRYKGLRAPHKIKMAVSGCTRECAEAQSKDIGVIASDKGWNLYVCGNGGMRPRHGELFATDLSTEQLVSYIDRILMFYSKTAARLQRTSVWIELLAGGLEYLQAVVIYDSLNIVDELEGQMQKIVSHYQCEWKTSLSDEQFLSRFHEYVNPEAAPQHKDLRYQYLREQKFPIQSQIDPYQAVNQPRLGAGDIAVNIIEEQEVSL
ncbi:MULTISPECIES: nitrite reductase large subunit NirB [unclassified Shewanella]|uniref:nitrite reductase large subunit NirB n=1 Tax=unclassified Shewanella TaxID=196818 RepID=UPI001BB8F541|nr:MULTISPECIES: nitrite reductase large subunit NirB [unclassified Shewanella]GIU07891.1 nitrite reductase large subunit [Shewanella sp. MBTL60-112-B1]GIU30553.1 nitrite reductase large subunit [Shewanella sp. MBTL60-112-B2]